MMDASEAIPREEHEAVPQSGRLGRVIDRLAIIPALGLVVAMLILIQEVVLRYVFGRPTNWAHETTVFLCAISFVYGGLLCTARDRHIRIEYFSESGSMARRKRLSQFGAVLVAALFFLIAGLSVRMVWDDFRFEETSPGIGVPQWWYSIWLPIVSTAIALRACGLFVRRGKQDDNEGASA